MTAGLFETFQREKRFIVDVARPRSAAPPGATQYGDPGRASIGMGLLAPDGGPAQFGGAQFPV